MLFDSRGIATIEALIALVVFSIGGLAAAGTAKLSLRAAHTGIRAARAARLLEGVVDHLSGAAFATDGRCDGLAAGADSNGRGEWARWSLQEAAHGRVVTIEVSYGASSGQRPDSALSFVRCY
jgi:Tfp pilus assembly protein PilV